MLLFVRKLFSLLSKSERRRATKLLLMIFIMAMLDVIGIASVMPFTAILTRPELIESNPPLNRIYEFSSVSETTTFSILMGLAFLIVFLSSLAFKALTIYAQIRFTMMLEHSLGSRLLHGYLFQPYERFLTRGREGAEKTILSEVGNVVNNVVLPSLILVAQSVIVILIVIVLLYVNATIALVLGSILGTFYLLLARLSSSYLRTIGEKRFSANERRYQIVGESMAAFKEIKVAGIANVVSGRYNFFSEAYGRYQANAHIVSQLPRFALEGLAFGGAVVMVIYLMGSEGGLLSALPVVSLFTLAGYRLIPALQQVFAAVTMIRFSMPALNDLVVELSKSEEVAGGVVPQGVALSEVQKNGEGSLSFNNVFFKYPGADKYSLRNLNLKLPKTGLFALVGQSGAGKSTICDLVLGLMPPTAGELLFRGTKLEILNFSTPAYNVGYVPQQPFIIEGTIESNITFDFNRTAVDHAMVIASSQAAGLHNYIQSHLSMGYQHSVTTGGAQLSVGQRQRIGIARALYRKPALLVMDEPTSALDAIAEQEVMDTLSSLSSSVPILLVTHKLALTRVCDLVIVVRDGEIVSVGKYEFLAGSCTFFREMLAT
jgi:ABC-type bacteriocin/lantibiotic exporter with double-glycine peptidase domain